MADPDDADDILQDDGSGGRQPTRKSRPRFKSESYVWLSVFTAKEERRNRGVAALTPQFAHSQQVIRQVNEERKGLTTIDWGTQVNPVWQCLVQGPTQAQATVGFYPNRLIPLRRSSVLWDGRPAAGLALVDQRNGVATDCQKLVQWSGMPPERC